MTDVPAPSSDTRPAVVAHRCYAGVAPENTVGAAKRAVSRSETAMLEIDVQPAACGTPVVIHDERLDGSRDGRPLTDGEGLVRNTSLDALRETRVLDTSETIPTLGEFLDALPSTVGLNVELKNPGQSDLRRDELLADAIRDERRRVWRPFVERVVETCDRFDGEVLFSSFCEGAIAALRDVDDRYPAAPLVWGDLDAGLEIARRYDCEAIHPPRSAILGTSFAGEAYAGIDGEPAVDLLETAHEEGRAVNVWTVETWVQAVEVADVGVDGLIVEYPGVVVEYPGVAGSIGR